MGEPIEMQEIGKNDTCTKEGGDQKENSSPRWTAPRCYGALAGLFFTIFGSCFLGTSLTGVLAQPTEGAIFGGVLLAIGLILLIGSIKAVITGSWNPFNC